MFDISFFELVVCGVVALIVVGPEEFPALVRNGIGLFRRARRMVSAVRTEVEYEFQKADELKRKIIEETRIAEMHDQLSEVVDEATHAVPTTFKLDPPQHQPHHQLAETPRTEPDYHDTAHSPTPEVDTKTPPTGSAHG